MEGACMYKIREYRLKSKLDQKEVAAMLGVTDGAVSNWERGTRMPDFAQAIKLSEIFGCSLDELAGRETPTRTLSEFERKMIDVFNAANAEGKKNIEMMIDYVGDNPKFRKKSDQVQTA